jgi:hypothetical protein
MDSIARRAVNTPAIERFHHKKETTTRYDTDPLRDGSEKTKSVPVGRGKPSSSHYTWWELVACGQEC